ncbi:MAG TPA: acyl-CoA dehydrogenase, partial [Thermoanaerobaculia bacterium]|nr:acyl-CoA dehydrogenase [Thermoanaerobaculia bacterium]
LGRLAAVPYPPLGELTPAEQAFLDGPVEEACRMVDDWELQHARELPEAMWAYLRRHGFFGLVIPEEYGGRGVSSLAASTVFGKLATRSAALSAVVLIPSSVGPGELLLEYGTEEQKARLLPRLARGDEIPCFALTEPEAGSDAAAIASRGVVFRGPDGRPWLRLDWDKRYITLAPVATLLGLAVRLEDPEELLGMGREPGITVVLVPTDLPGVETGRHHDPLGVPMPNGPTRGRGVEVPADAIVGGPAYAGRGWRMLMEALSAGRAISLPAQSVAGAKALARGVGAYAAVRRQFGIAIGRFEGIEEPLARIAGFAYAMEAARVVTCAAIDAGHRPAVISGLVKYRQTELFRSLAADGMDVVGGAGISLGPRNLIGRAWIGAPIGITVEGANILTRTLIVFGQGVIRSHPWALALLRAVEADDPRAFRRALLGQAGSFLGNLVRAPWLSLTRGRLVRSPVACRAGPWWRRLAWASASFALLTDLALLSLGGKLKLRGKLSGRFADALSWIYLAFATLRRFEAEGRRREDEPLLDWAAGECLHRADRALHGILENFEGPLGWLLRGPAALWSRLNPIARAPSDRLGGRVAGVLLTQGEQRDRLTADIYVPTGEDETLAVLERAFELAAEAEPLLARVRKAQKKGAVPAGPTESVLAEAVAAGVLDEAE